MVNLELEVWSPLRQLYPGLLKTELAIIGLTISNLWVLTSSIFNKPAHLKLCLGQALAVG